MFSKAVTAGWAKQAHNRGGHRGALWGTAEDTDNNRSAGTAALKPGASQTAPCASPAFPPPQLTHILQIGN